MSKQKSDSFKNLFFWFLIIIGYISFINIFVIKTTPEFLLIQFAFITTVFLTSRLKDYAIDWIPFIGFFLLYEFLRGFADDLSPFRTLTLLWIYKLEQAIFGTLPTLSLQQLFGENKLIINISLFFYALFFYYSFLTAFIIWIYNRNLFKEYANKFLLLSITGLVFFFLIPTAPPWLIEKSENLGIRRIIYEGNILDNYVILTLYNYLFHGNEVAALPSLHSAWPMFTSLFIVKKFKNRFRYLLLIIPLMVGFSVVLSGEHFILDVLFGFFLAYLVLNIPYGLSWKHLLKFKDIIKT